MKPIEKHELYENLRQFLKGKGIELTEGSYSKGIHAGCSLLADAINLSQTGLERAKNGIERNVDRVRQVIHEKTAPRSARSPQPPPPRAAADGRTASQKPGNKNRGKSRKRGKM